MQARDCPDSVLCEQRRGPGHVSCSVTVAPHRLHWDRPQHHTEGLGVLTIRCRPLLTMGPPLPRLASQGLLLRLSPRVGHQAGSVALSLIPWELSLVGRLPFLTIVCISCLNVDTRGFSLSSVRLRFAACLYSTAQMVPPGEGVPGGGSDIVPGAPLCFLAQEPSGSAITPRSPGSC